MVTFTIRDAQAVDGPEIFQIIGMVGVESRAFRHAGHGFVGLHIMWKDLAFLRVLL